MTKIVYIGEQREIPYLGILTDGDIREVPDDIAKGLIAQGQAVIYRERKQIDKGGKD